ncbi:T9SS type A sorting domain-containing protein [Urechidicola croceus]|uniref:Secretion system C-terminal sorting domain-containing protein n=1 Tax=Urechidicola croceus TaxID=1850246 RepID=A0A1D8P9D1_9FLAO|nr:T9SS type A sorting domain-containing protein [Urechidicola croceus]AOW21181.1 hypothetical protein LPB138_11040 [Urechidicola croceus]
MKKNYFILFTVLISLTSFSQNLTDNGDFETWTGGVLDTWTSEAGTNITEETVIVAEGNSAANFEVITGDQGNTDFRQSISVVSGVTYDVSVQIYQVDNGSRTRIYAGGYSVYSDESLVGEWQTISTQYVASTSGDIEFGLRFYDTSGFDTSSTIIVDDYQVVAQTTPSLSVVSPANGSTIPDTSVDIELSVQNFVVANGTGDGHIQYSVDGGSVEEKYDTNPISLSGLSEGSHSVELELVDNSNLPLSTPVTATVTFTVSSIIQVTDISQLRSGTIGDFYQLNGNAIITYTRSSRNQKYIEDFSGSGRNTGSGILIDDSAGTITSTLVEGDVINGLTGQLSEYNGVLQFVPSADISASSSGSITPEATTTGTLFSGHESFESELVSLTGVVFADAGGTFETGTQYTINDGSGDLVFRTNFNEADYIGQTIPTGNVDLVVLVSEFNGTPQVVARDITDILGVEKFNQIEGFSVYPNPVSNGQFSLTSSSRAIKSVKIFNVFGKVVYDKNIDFEESIKVNKLSPGIYILKVEEEGKLATRKLIIE